MAVACGRNHTLALGLDGKVWAWGYNGYGQLGIGNTNSRNNPGQVVGLTDIIAIAPGEYHSLALKRDGTVWAWGYNIQGQLGIGSTDYNAHSLPVQVATLSAITTLAAGTQSIAVKGSGIVYSWGNNGNGQLGSGNNANTATPQVSLFTFANLVKAEYPIILPDGGAYVSPQIVSISCATSGATLRYTTNGNDPTTTDPSIANGGTVTITAGTSMLKVKAFKTGITNSDVKTAVYQIGEKLVSGYTYTLAIKSDSLLWVWGNNNQGQLGNGSTGSKFYPFVNSKITNIIDAAAGTEHSLAVASDSTVWAFGRNSEGQLGDGSLSQQTAPVKVNGLTKIQKVSAGYYHSLALKSDGTVWSWGQNNYGQLGNGNYFNGAIPSQVTGVNNVIAVSGGDSYSLALTADGSVYGWGYNGNGQLGNGSYSSTNVPTLVNGFSATTLATGRYHTLAPAGDGTVWAWGYNGYGQLGTGNTSGQPYPTQVAGLSGVIAIAAGEYASLAVKSDGTVWSWGYNGQGQLGYGTTDGNAHSTPAQILTLSNMTMVAAGTHSMAVKSDGSVWAWGYNQTGQFGDGSNISSPVPVQSRFKFRSAPQAAVPVITPDGGSYYAGLRLQSPVRHPVPHFAILPMAQNLLQQIR